MVGQWFGRWLVLGDAGNIHNSRHFLCRCECGVEKAVKGTVLRRGKSTGCVRCVQLKPWICGHDPETARRFDHRGRPYCHECKKAWKREWRKQPSVRAREREQARNYILKRKYGISREEFDATLERQGGVCAICKTDNWGGKGKAIDHSRRTGKVRGILCNRCNTGLGLFLESPKRLRAAIGYLKEYADGPSDHQGELR